MEKRIEKEEEAVKKKIEDDNKIKLDVDDKLVGDDKIFEQPQKERSEPDNNY